MNVGATMKLTVLCAFLGACRVHSPPPSRASSPGPPPAKKLVPAAPQEPSPAPVHQSNRTTTQTSPGIVSSPGPRAGHPDRDFVVRIGMGFRPDEVDVLRRAVATWIEATGLPITLREGYGPAGSVHLVEQIPVCGQRWVYDGYLGCYSPEDDLVVLNRHGIEYESRKTDDLLYIVLLHELGHWLGLGHAERGEESIMQPDYPQLATRGVDFATISALDLQRVCEKNTCSPDLDLEGLRKGEFAQSSLDEQVRGSKERRE